jgi:hypothetical protein
VTDASDALLFPGVWRIRVCGTPGIVLIRARGQGVLCEATCMRLGVGGGGLRMRECDGGDVESRIGELGLGL